MNTTGKLKRATLVFAIVLSLPLGIAAWRALRGPDKGSREAAKITVPAASDPVTEPYRQPSVPPRPWGTLTEDDKRFTAAAKPTLRTSMRLLDLSEVPTESDLRMAGQLGDELHSHPPRQSRRHQG